MIAFILMYIEANKIPLWNVSSEKMIRKLKYMFNFDIKMQCIDQPKLF